ncbi:hypothetical protein LZ31DRAFT_553794 [Colletotrichum somersetense]|nr:hypothetical protein LZ31DRAFT_553794 [Colletotrichum somersetense]
MKFSTILLQAAVFFTATALPMPNDSADQGHLLVGRPRRPAPSVWTIVTGPCHHCQ